MPRLANTRITLLVLLTAFAAAVATLLISVAPFLSFAYRSTQAHLVIETAASFVASVAAVLVYGRFRRTRRHSDFVLLVSMMAFAGTNLFFSVLPPVAGVDRGGSFATWAPVLGRLLAAGLFAWAAFARDVPARRFERPRFGALAILAGLGIVGALAVLLGDALPDPFDAALSPEGAERPRIVGSPLLLGQFVLSMVLFSAAAAGFLRRARTSEDELSRWLAVAAVLAAFARLNYFLFPSLYSEWVYTGDLFRLGFFALLCAGAGREIVRAQQAQATAAVLEERRRVARDIHDGLAQELSFIVAHAHRLGERAVGRREEQRVVLLQLQHAAERALDEARAAIEVLTTPIDEPLDEALCRSAEYVAERLGARVRCRVGHQDLHVAAHAREALVRVVREAATNAVRHGEADTISLDVDGPGPLRISIADDGRGFEPATVNGRGFGLTSMRERVEALGGTLTISSAPGEGTVVSLEIP